MKVLSTNIAPAFIVRLHNEAIDITDDDAEGWRKLAPSSIMFAHFEPTGTTELCAVSLRRGDDISIECNGVPFSGTLLRSRDGSDGSLHLMMQI